METGENIVGLRRIIDMSRAIAILVLLLHFYISCYQVFSIMGWTHPLLNKVVDLIEHLKIFQSVFKTKLIIIGFILLSLFGTKGEKNEHIIRKYTWIWTIFGLTLFFFSAWIISIKTSIIILGISYIAVCSIGIILFMTGAARLSRTISYKFSHNVFNMENETFPQMEAKVKNDSSLHFRTQYYLRNKRRNGWINVINPYRGILVMGLPGSGKTYFVIKSIIQQQIANGFSLFIYDFKYPDLTTIAYQSFVSNKVNYLVEPVFYVLDFDNPTFRCNPLMLESLVDITDAAEASRTILFGLNQSWIKKKGDFWIESSVNLVTAAIWYLRKYQNGRFCTLAHVIELLQTPYQELFSVMRIEPEVNTLIQPFITAFENDAKQQLEGQISGATVSLGKLSSPNLYYILSGDDFNMDIANPDEPKIVCVANNPQKSNIYSSVISLYLSSLKSYASRSGNLKSSIILEEFPTLYFNGIDQFLAICRSYQVSLTMVIQDFSQLRLHYGRDQADAIFNIVGNVISGQVTGESAKHLSEGFGRILQSKQAISTDNQLRITHTKQLDYAIPQSTISSLSSGEFVGIVADNPDQRIQCKMFHGEILLPSESPRLLNKNSNTFKESIKEGGNYEEFIKNIKQADSNLILNNFNQIKNDIYNLIQGEMNILERDTSLHHLIISKTKPNAQPQNLNSSQ